MNLADMNKEEKQKYFEDLKKHIISKQANCMFGDCKKKSIGSHSISKKFYLKKIAEDNQVGAFVSKRIKDDRELVWERVGINKASVFMGYCKEHDELFNSIDINGINTVKDLLLQCYRTISFWLNKTEMAAALMGAIHDDANDTMKSFVEKNIPNLDYNEIMFGEDYQKQKYNDVDSLKKIKRDFETIITEKNNTMLDNIIENTIYQQGNYEIMYYKVSERIPVIVNSMNTVKGGEVFHIVLPNDKTTELIVINATNNKVKFKEAWEARTSNILKIISLIECWMIGDENWYLSPSVFEMFSEAKIQTISDDIRYSQCERKLWQPYDISIFDELRKKYVKEYASLLDKQRVEEETNRMSLIPTREEREKREAHMRQAIAERLKYNTYRRK